jgi:hypothetical protein
MPPFQGSTPFFDRIQGRDALASLALAPGYHISRLWRFVWLSYLAALSYFAPFDALFGYLISQLFHVSRLRRCLFHLS